MNETVFPSWLSPNQVAARLGVSVRTVARAVADGRLQGVRVGARIRIDPASIVGGFVTKIEPKKGVTNAN